MSSPKTLKVITTIRNGITVSSKQVEVQNPVNPETGRHQKPPEHGKILDLGDASFLSIRDTLASFEALMSEARSLRKKLVASENQARARTKEREALKKALLSKNDKISTLEEKVEDLTAKLCAMQDDYKHLEGELAKAAKLVSTSRGKPVLSAPKPIKIAPSPEELLEEDTRAIAAKPVKR